MKKLLIITALALTSAFAVVPRSSAQTAQFTFTPTSFPSAAPGSTIQFGISLVFTSGGNMANVAGLTYFLQQTGAAPFIFTIVGRDRTGSQFTDPITADSFFNTTHDPMNSTTNPTGSNSADLGALTTATGNPPMATPLPSGTYFIANISLQIAANAAPGTYTVTSTTTGGKRSVINDSGGFNTFPISPASLTITVVPEPSTYALIAVGGIALLGVAYRRRRALS